MAGKVTSNWADRYGADGAVVLGLATHGVDVGEERAKGICDAFVMDFRVVRTMYRALLGKTRGGRTESADANRVRPEGSEVGSRDGVGDVAHTAQVVGVEFLGVNMFSDEAVESSLGFIVPKVLRRGEAWCACQTEGKPSCEGLLVARILILSSPGVG